MGVFVGTYGIASAGLHIVTTEECYKNHASWDVTLYSLHSFHHKMASKIITSIKTAAGEPLLTGALLYVLTRGPDSVRVRLLAPFQSNVLAKNGAARLAVFITVLKILTGAGVLKRINQALNSLAWNNWSIGRRPGAAFKFGPNKEELVIITGGSSGFGYEMVKAFSRLARVVALDIQDFPPELASRKFNLLGFRILCIE